MKWKNILVPSLIFCAFAAAFMLFLSRERHFDWDQRYLSRSDEPYGLKLFDKLMKESMSKGYEVMRFPDTKRKDYNLLVIAESFKLSRRNTIAIYNHLKAGNDVMLIAELPDVVEQKKDENDLASTQYDESDTNDNSRYSKVIQKAKEIRQRGKTIENLIITLREGVTFGDEAETPQQLRKSPTLQLTNPLTRVKDRKTVTARQGFCTTFFDEDIVNNQKGGNKWNLHNKYTIPANNTTSKEVKAALAAHAKVGKGNLYVISAAHCFTNAGILDDKTLPFVVSTMDMIADRSVVRVTDPYHIGMDPSESSEEKQEEETESIFQFFHKQKALNLMLYITLAGILLAIFFNARRRQRAINVKKPERNTTLAFIRQIASLHMIHTDYRELYVNKLYAFAELVRKKVGADIFNCTEKDIEAIAGRTGLSQNEIRTQIALLMNYNRTEGKKRLTFEEFTTAANIIRNIKKKIVESR